MTNKLLFERYVYYGKYDGEELVESYVVTDYPELRQELTDEHANSDTEESDIKQFLAGKSNSLETPHFDGDWDDPTASLIMLRTYDEKRHQIERAYKSDLDALNKQFGINN